MRLRMFDYYRPSYGGNWLHCLVLPATRVFSLYILPVLDVEVLHVILFKLSGGITGRYHPLLSRHLFEAAHEKGQATNQHNYDAINMGLSDIAINMGLNLDATKYI